MRIHRDLFLLINKLNQANFLKKNFFFFRYTNSSLTLYYLLCFYYIGIIPRYYIISKSDLDVNYWLKKNLTAKRRVLTYFKINNLDINLKVYKWPILKIYLNYNSFNNRIFKKIYLISKNRQKVILTFKELKYFHSKNQFTGFFWLSTQWGLMSMQKALSLRIGGFLIFKIV
jgi:ribosomal protein S8